MSIDVVVSKEALESLPATVQEDLLFAVARAVSEHQESGKSESLTALSEQIQTTVWLHAQPGFGDAQLIAPKKPIGLGHDTDETFSRRAV